MVPLSNSDRPIKLVGKHELREWASIVFGCLFAVERPRNNMGVNGRVVFGDSDKTQAIRNLVKLRIFRSVDYKFLEVDIFAPRL